VEDGHVEADDHLLKKEEWRNWVFTWFSHIQLKIVRPFFFFYKTAI
jgi:hypothetical protein